MNHEFTPPDIFRPWCDRLSVPGVCVLKGKQTWESAWIGRQIWMVKTCHPLETVSRSSLQAGKCWEYHVVSQSGAMLDEVSNGADFLTITACP